VINLLLPIINCDSFTIAIKVIKSSLFLVYLCKVSLVKRENLYVAV